MPGITNDSITIPTKPSGVSRTIMVYIVGSDLESSYGAATMDIQEMLDADISDDTTVLLCTGGSKEWKNDVVSARSTSIFLVDNEGITEVESNPAKNMANSSTLTYFLDYCKTNYKSDEYGLILWNHGGGPLLGYGLDEIKNEMMNIPSLNSALDSSSFGDTKLEFLGFDACLMGSVETAWHFKDNAEYFIASQETEPGQGWDYSFLSDIDNCTDGAQIGKLIVDKYMKYYKDLYKKYPYAESEITLSCTDLSKISAVESSVDSLFKNVNSDVISDGIADVSRCRYRTKAFGKSTSSSSYDLVDITHLTSLLHSHYPDEAKALSSALDKYVVYTASNVSNANGTSLYHPYDNTYMVREWVSQFDAFDFAPNYADYIKNFSEKMKQGGSQTQAYRNFSDVKAAIKADGQKSDLSMTLTEEQQKTFSSAKYYIFHKVPDEESFSDADEYLHVFSGQDAVLSDNGKLSATYEGKAVFGKNKKTGEISEMPLAMNQIYDGTGDEKFYMPCMFMAGDFIDGLELEPVNWVMKIKDSKPKLLSAYSIDAQDDSLIPDKYIINADDFDTYTFANNAYTFGSDDSGNLTLEFTGSSYGYEYTKKDGVELELRPIEDRSQYVAMFVIEDIYGNSYNSGLIELNSK